MKILLISPLGFPVNEKSKYAGIEHLVWEFSRELVKNHDVTVMAHSASIFPEGVKLLATTPMIDGYEGEVRQYQSYHYTLKNFDVIHDFSHLQLAARYNKLPTLNVFWHAPSTAKYPKAPYNIIGLSQWAVREFKRVYHQDGRYQETIGIDPDIYKPARNESRNERYLSIGRMAPEKGNLAALKLCQILKVPIDVAGGRGTEKTSDTPLDNYEKTVIELAQKPPNRYLGEVSDVEKIKLMQTCKALIYMTNHPEVTSHKIQEAMFCGARVIVPALGGVPEIVTHGVDGYLCSRDSDYIDAIDDIDKLTPEKTRESLIKKYAIKKVVANYIPLYEQVAGGLRW